MTNITSATEQTQNDVTQQIDSLLVTIEKVRNHIGTLIFGQQQVLNQGSQKDGNT